VAEEAEGIEILNASMVDRQHQHQHQHPFEEQQLAQQEQQLIDQEQEEEEHQLEVRQQQQFEEQQMKEAEEQHVDDAQSENVADGTSHGVGRSPTVPYNQRTMGRILRQSPTRQPRELLAPDLSTEHVKRMKEQRRRQQLEADGVLQRQQHFFAAFTVVGVGALVFMHFRRA
jgi:hypothetical protein